MGAAVIGGLGWTLWRGFGVEAEEARQGTGHTGRLPNTKLYTHEGREVRFYDDLVRGKVVAINLMYADCEGICPMATSNLLKVQELLGDRVGRDVFMYSITLQPEHDSPGSLKHYAEMHGVKPGWLFLTGAPSDVRSLRYRLGFYDPDPRVDGDKETHTGMVRIGNDLYDRWTMAPSLGGPATILATINHVDRSVVHTAPLQ
jgi:protein SCO1/2